jgi:RHS repeat-associated protein
MCLTDRKLERTDIPATTLSYNVDGQLLSTTTPLGTTTYGYAADGKRVWSQKPGEAKRFYIYSGDVLIGEIYNDTTQPSISSYTYGPDGLLAIQQDTTTYWPVYGPQGETRALTDVNGAVVQTYAYDGYGIQIPTTLPATVRNPFQYGGKYGYYTDHESGFILATYRWYSPQLRRWVSRDPIGYEGGVNLYEYVDGNPIMYVDPLGWEKLPQCAINILKKFFPKTRGHAALGQAELENIEVHPNYLPSSGEAYGQMIGGDIAFKSGYYYPKNAVGLALIAHELTHVAQWLADPAFGSHYKRASLGLSKRGKDSYRRNKFEKAAWDKFLNVKTVLERKYGDKDISCCQ